MEVKGSFAVPRQIRIIENGKVEVKRSYEMKGITEEMLALHRDSPGDALQKYLAWHPDHIDRRYVEKRGRTIMLEKQKIGKRVYSMKASVPSSGGGSGGTMTWYYKIPLIPYQWQSQREFTPTGTTVHSTNIYGSDTPIVGWLWNLFLRKCVLPSFMTDFFKHQDEEAENTLKAVQEVWAERNNKEKQPSK